MVYGSGITLSIDKRDEPFDIDKMITRTDPMIFRKVRESTDILPSAFSYLCIVSHESATKQVLRVEIAGINSSNC